MTARTEDLAHAIVSYSTMRAAHALPCTFAAIAISFSVSVPSTASADIAAPAPPAVAGPDPRCPTATFEAATVAAKVRVAQVVALAETFDKLAQGPDADDACRVALFQIYWKFYGDVQKAMADRMNPFEKRAFARYERELKTVGWKLEESEGGNYVRNDSDWLVRRVGPRLPADWREFVTLDVRDDIEGFDEDGGLIIGLPVLRARIRRWESFAARYPSFPLAERVRANTLLFLRTLLIGMDSSPAFGPEDGVLVPAFKAQLQAYFRDPKARDRVIVRGYYQLLEKHDFRLSAEARAYLEKNGLAPPEGMDPRGYREAE